MYIEGESAQFAQNMVKTIPRSTVIPLLEIDKDTLEELIKDEVENEFSMFLDNRTIRGVCE